jgi:hypothetical protein
VESASGALVHAHVHIFEEYLGVRPSPVAIEPASHPLAVQITTYNFGDLLGKMAPLVFVLRDDNAIVVSPL